MESGKKPCLPKHFFPYFVKLTHGLDHMSKGSMVDALTKFCISVYAFKLG